MRIASRLATLTVAASLTVTFAPGLAYADTTVSNLTAAQMAAALKDVAATTQTAADRGWHSSTKLTSGSLALAEQVTADPAGGRALLQIQVGKTTSTSYFAEHKGTYDLITDSLTRSVLKMMNKPNVRYVFTADKKLDLDSTLKDSATPPAVVLTDDVTYAGTKTVKDDGSADYAFKSADGTSATLHVTSDGILTSAVGTGPDLKATLTYSYGPQTVTLPGVFATISPAELAKGAAYLQMADLVKAGANQAAAGARKTAKGHTVKVSTVRSAASKAASSINKDLQVTMLKVKNTTKGANVYATNPWTHKTVTYAVEASGKKVTVKKK